MAVTGLVWGALFGGGLVAFVGSAWGLGSTTGSARRAGRGTRRLDSARLFRVAGALVAGAAVVAVTSWPVAGVAAAAAVMVVPSLFGSLSGQTAVERVEAVATWTEMLLGTLAASAGVGEAIGATAAVAPLAIRADVASLAGRLHAGVPTAQALVRFADDVADPCADRVVCSLLLATSAPAQRLGDLLAALADATRDEVAVRVRVETSRSTVRSSVRLVIACSLLFAAALVVVARSYLAPFSSIQGQIVLAAVIGLYGAGVVLMAAMSRMEGSERLLSGGGPPR
jgi:tight adherence protein B